MKYTCTRDSAVEITSSAAILSGIAPDGGLYLPTSVPVVSQADMAALQKLDYPGRAAYILGLFLDDFTVDELTAYTREAYSAARFSAATPAPVAGLANGMHILELFHGPTSAFKDFALQLLPHLLTASAKKNGVTDDIVILVATSGDTGKAALEGFADVPGTRIGVFYPYGGTSEIQKLQMTTQAGANVRVTAVRGNFDDAQSGVKRIFTNASFARELSAKGLRLSSANSINWGRLAPQIAYYFSAYCDLVSAGSIAMGDKVNICVPTGNFGNILAAFFAKRAGLPVNKFICASNRNNVLTDFIATGVYDRNRAFHVTTSPSMDILISSNLERLLYLLCKSDAQVRGYMQSLSECGRYTVSGELHSAIRSEFECGFADDAMAASTIRQLFEKQGYLADPHTAVAVNVYEAYRSSTGDDAPVIIASTASPFKFPGSVLQALGHANSSNEFDMIQRISTLAGLSIPPRLAELQNRAERFTGVIGPDEMQAFVAGFAR